MEEVGFDVPLKIKVISSDILIFRYHPERLSVSSALHLLDANAQFYQVRQHL